MIMTRFLTAIAALSAFGAVFPAHAQSRSGWDLAAELYHYAYREPLDGPDVKDDGLFLGGAVGYTIVRGPWVGRLRGAAALGSVDYSSGSGTLNGVRQTVGQLELDVGRDVEMTGGATLTPYLGLGARLLFDQSGGKVTSQGSEGYDRRIAYHYAAAGFALNTPDRSGRSFTFTGQYNRLFGGSSKSYFSDTDPENPDVDLAFRGGYGLEANALINFNRGDHQISVGPFARYWDIDSSKSAVFTYPERTITVTEPANSTWELGLRTSYRF